MRQWKVGERILAKLLRCERVPITGRSRGRAMSDLISDRLAVEVKTRKALPVFLAEAMDQAERGAAYAERKDGRSRLPIVVVHADRTDYANSLVVVRLKNAAPWLGVDGEVEERGAGPLPSWDYLEHVR